MRFIQVGGAARQLGYSAGWIRYLADTGRLPSDRTTSGVRLFRDEDLKNFIRKRREGAASLGTDASPAASSQPIGGGRVRTGKARGLPSSRRDQSVLPGAKVRDSHGA